MNSPIEEGDMDPLEEEAVHPAMAHGTIGNGPKHQRKFNWQQTDLKRPKQDRHATGRCDFRNWCHANQGRSHPSDSDRRENPEPLSGGNDAQVGHSRDATSRATAFEPLNSSLETFLTRLSRTNERSEKTRRVFKKPRCYKDKCDGCIDTWIEVLKLHFEEEDCIDTWIEVLKLHFKEELSPVSKLTSSKLCDGQKAIPAGHC